MAKRRMRDFQRCLRNIQSFSGNQATVIEWDEEEMGWLTVQIRPTDSYYGGGQFDFKIIFESTDVKQPPRVDCLTQIYHPNIDTTCDENNVCLSLFDEWEDQFGLEDVVQGLLFLLYNPNIEDPLSPYFDPSMEEDELRTNIERSMQGEEVEGMLESLPVNNHEQFEEQAIAEGIQLILEKASQLVLAEEEEEDEDDKDEGRGSEDAGIEEEDSNEDSEVDVPSEGAGSINPIMCRQESKVDKSETLDILNTTEPMIAGGRQWQDYIPPTFIPPQPDFAVNAVIAWFNIISR